MSDPINVLFICTANICRSAYAEFYGRAAAQRQGLDLAFDSAGISAWNGSPMDPPMAAQLTARGISADGFASERVTAAHVRWADVILTMQNFHRGYLIEEHPAAIAKLYTLGQLVTNFPDDSALRGRELLSSMTQRRGSARPEDEVPDPFRQGDEAIAACATHLDGLIDSFLSRM